MPRRLNAIRVQISDITKGIYEKDGNVHRVTSPLGLEVRRAVIVGYIVDQYDAFRDFSMMVLDDTTGTIKVKGWGRESKILGSAPKDKMVRVMGRVRRYEGEVYLVPDFVRAIEDPHEIVLHLLERKRALSLLGKRREVGSLETPSPTLSTHSPVMGRS